MSADDQDPPDFYTGAPLDPEDLWFREEIIRDLWTSLKRQHAILSAPRRTGKTSVMDYLVENPKESFKPVKIFVQDLKHPAEFILTLLDAFHDLHPALFRTMFSKGSSLVSKVLGGIDELGIGGFKVALREQDDAWEANWKKHGDSFLATVRASGDRVLFVVDEFPDMILNMHRTSPELIEPFLSWFRGHRLTPPPKKDAIRWLLGGSVNLASTLDALDCLDKVNDFHDETLPTFSRAEIVEFIERMLGGRGVEMADGFPEFVAARIGRPIPLFLQMLAQDLFRKWRKTKCQLTVEEFECVFDDLVISSAARDKLQHYYSRIERYYDEPNRSAAYSILGILSRSEEGLSRETLFRDYERVIQEIGRKDVPPHARQRLFNQLMRDLENDFYIAIEPSEEKGAATYDFSSGLLKAWWRKYYA